MADEGACWPSPGFDLYVKLNVTLHSGLYADAPTGSSEPKEPSTLPSADGRWGSR
jgi:hypothetical protein